MWKLIENTVKTTIATVAVISVVFVPIGISKLVEMGKGVLDGLGFEG